MYTSFLTLPNLTKFDIETIFIIFWVDFEKSQFWSESVMINA